MDGMSQELVKSHLMFAVREEVNSLKARISALTAQNSRLELENKLLRQHATSETIAKLQRTCSTSAAEPGATTTPHN